MGNKPTHIIIHHSLTKDSETVSWGAIRRYHMQTLGWNDIGYHFGIERVGDHPEVLVGRDLNVRGAHCKELGMNERSIGICIVGNFDDEPPAEEIWKRAVAFTASLLLIEMPSSPVANVKGHREIGLEAGFDWRKGQYKSCPGRSFDMDKFRQDVLAAKWGG